MTIAGERIGKRKNFVSRVAHLYQKVDKDKIMDNTISIKNVFDEQHGLSFDDAEKRMLWRLLEVAVESGQISLPDRHPGATKYKQLIITFSRRDNKDWQSDVPVSEVEMVITERKQ